MSNPCERPRVAIGSLKLLSPPYPGQVSHDMAVNLMLLSEPEPGQLLTPKEYAEAQARDFGRPGRLQA